MIKRVLFVILSVFMVELLAEEASSEKIGETKQMKVQAGTYEEKQDYSAAASLYKKLALRFDEPTKKVYFLLKEAECYFNANKTHKAVEAYQKIIKKYSLYIPLEDVIDKIRTLAERYVKGEGTFLGLTDRSSGIEIYYLILREAPSIHTSLKDRIRLAELLKEDGKLEEAVSVYQEVIKLDPEQNDIRLELAKLLVKLSQSGDGDGALRRNAKRYAEMILEREPNYLRKNEVELILAETNEQDAMSLLNLGKFYLRPSHYNVYAAKNYLQEVVQKYPNTRPAWEAKELMDAIPQPKKP